MKNLIVVFVIFSSLLSNAQITIDSNTNFHVECYAGILSGSNTPLDTKNPKAFMTLREGANIKWIPNKSVSLFGVASLEINEAGVASPFYLTGIRLTPQKNILVTIGKIGTPMTELRPLPNTGTSQFEPWTLGQIPGSAFGGKITYTFNQKHSLVGGYFLRSNDPSIEIGAHLSYVQAVLYYRTVSSMYGGACTITTKYINQTLVYNHNKNFGSFTLVKMPKVQGVLLYSDMGFGNNNFNMIRGEWGILKTFSHKMSKGLAGIGYAQEIKNTKLYLMINL